MPTLKKKLILRKKKPVTSNSFPRKKNKAKYENSRNNSNNELKKKQNYDKAGVKRIFSPFTKFSYTVAQQGDKVVMANKNIKFQNSGLSQKEKSYVICCCQNKSMRYIQLKSQASKAIKEKKIFSVYGSCNAVRKALVERNWVERIPSNRMNLNKIRSGNYSSKTKLQSELERILLSNFVEKHNPNFVWRTKDQRRFTATDMTKDYNTIVNKLEIDAVWTSKQGLCSSMKRNYWFYIEDVAEVTGPRTYNTCDNGEIEGFVKDYKITTCTSLLKWILSMVANDRPIFVPSGKISMNVLVYALNRCKEYLFRKQNKDIDQSIPSVSAGQWNSFLKKYYSIIGHEEVFQDDKDNKLPLYLKYAKFLLKEIYRYRPQLSCEGCHNIWILKPAYCSRGRGIRLASKLGVIINLLEKANSKYVIQKYIEDPLLIYETKFDIRQYYLVTSTYPLIIWMYTECYLKFSSQKYNLKNYHESIHLTNNAVQRKYKNCKQRNVELPINNMWDLEMYKSYLDKIGKDGVWQNVIYPGMKKSIIGIMLSCQDSLSVSKNRFELYGCDFILDKEYNPWLIEINSCPDLNHTTPVTSKICPAVVSDIIKVVIDYANDPKASTGNFECIYRQPITLPRYVSAAELLVRGHSLPLGYFYKGKIEVREPYDNLKTGCSIKGVFNELKQFYNEDEIMKQPEEDYCALKMKKNVAPEATSESEMNIGANTIPKELDELHGTMTSENSLNSKCLLKQASSQSLDKSSNPVQRVQNLTDIKSFLRDASQVTSSENANNFFNFSILDDGPVGKASIVELNTIENNATNDTYSTSEASLQSSSNNFSHDFKQATLKIMTFINEKEKEYRHC